MGLFLLSPAARFQNPMNPVLTALVGADFTTVSSTRSAVEQPDGNNELQDPPQDTVPVEPSENRASLEVRLYIMQGRLVPMQALNLGMTTVTQILAQAGVRVRWLDKDPQRSSKSGYTPCGPGRTAPTIVVIFSETAPERLEPAVVAQARPYATDGVRITFFRDRLQSFFYAMPSWVGSVLGHVMAHEIAHVLQGISRHSETGLMRPHWSHGDYRQMPVKPLPLTPYDIQLIRRGMAGWCARMKGNSWQSAP